MAIIPMRQKNHKSTLDVPLGLTRTKELIDNSLCSICKVSELGFPDGEGVRGSLGVAVLEAHHCELGQVGVAGLEVLLD